MLKQNNSKISVIVRIDNMASYDIDSYAEYADAIYFYRMIFKFNESLSKICFYQKSITSKCNSLGISNLSIHFHTYLLKTLQEFRL